jgi:argininosuccinate lyase
LEGVSAVAVSLAGLGRVVQDLLLWCTREFGYLRLADEFVQCSSIMPQKRNPVALEHARAIASKAVGQANAIVIAVHNTPFGDIVDTEDDLQPLVFSMYNDAIRMVGLVAAAMSTAEFNRERLAARAGAGWITVTELADTLARDKGVPFRKTHEIATRLVAEATRRPEEPLNGLLAEISADLLGSAVQYSPQDLAEILSPQHFVRVRTTPGGPAPSETARAHEASTKRLTADTAWLDDTIAALRAADHELTAAAARL